MSSGQSVVTRKCRILHKIVSFLDSLSPFFLSCHCHHSSRRTLLLSLSSLPVIASKEGINTSHHVFIHVPDYGARRWRPFTAGACFTCLIRHSPLLVSHKLCHSCCSLQFVKIVVSLLLLTTLTIFVAGVARIHMAILSFLSAGLLFSLSMFESEYKKVAANREGADEPAPASNGSSNKANKTD